jgi:uncharacterized membrane protein YeiH
MVFYLLDLAGVALFSFSGALAGGRAGLDLLGVVVIATVTAIGGGTVRDLLLNRHPMFWISDPVYLIVTAVVGLATVLYVRVLPAPGNALIVADALALALFAMMGAEIAESTTHSPLIVVLMGTISGVVGGVIRDVLTAQVPLLLGRDIYATAAIAGVTLYLVLQKLGVPRSVAFGAGLASIVALRLGAITWDWHLPVFRLAQ